MFVCLYIYTHLYTHKHTYIGTKISKIYYDTFTIKTNFVPISESHCGQAVPRRKMERIMVYSFSFAVVT